MDTGAILISDVSTSLWHQEKLSWVHVPSTNREEGGCNDLNYSIRTIGMIWHHFFGSCHIIHLYTQSTLHTHTHTFALHFNAKARYTDLTCSVSVFKMQPVTSLFWCTAARGVQKGPLRSRRQSGEQIITNPCFGSLKYTELFYLQRRARSQPHPRWCHSAHCRGVMPLTAALSSLQYRPPPLYETPVLPCTHYHMTYNSCEWVSGILRSSVHQQLYNWLCWQLRNVAYLECSTKMNTSH